jgi:DNA end-binding protein Ku
MTMTKTARAKAPQTTTPTPAPKPTEPSRAILKCVIQFATMNIPVRVMSAVQDRNEVGFTTLHKDCGAKLKHKPQCPIHTDEEMTDENTVRAYEAAKGQFVEISDEALASIPDPEKQVIKLERVVNASEIPVDMHEKTYFLAADMVGARPFALLAATLAKKKRVAVARITLRSRERICVLRPNANGGLNLETLLYPEELRPEPKAAPMPMPTAQELRIASLVLDELSGPFVADEYPDKHRAALLAIVEKALQTSEAKAAPTVRTKQAQPDLMAQLQASLAMIKQQKGESA